MTKEYLIRIIQDLPEDEAFPEIAKAIETICFKASVQRGLDQLDRGEGIPHEEIEKKIAAWLKE